MMRRIDLDWELSSRQAGGLGELIPDTGTNTLEKDTFGIRKWSIAEKVRKSHGPSF